MNILVPNSWLFDYLKTNATPKEFADVMSLTSVSIEHMNKVGNDVVFDIEVTSNRPDLMSIQGLAREARAVLPQAGFKAEMIERKTLPIGKTVKESPLLTIKYDKALVNRIVAVVMEIELGKSPEKIVQRLEKTGIRSISNVVDVTNYIMRETGHPSHVFDYDRLKDHQLIIRRSKKGERIETLDGKIYTLPGNDIVADNGNGDIVDLLGIMGTSNSVVTDTTKRIVLFLDNNNPYLLRKTSMQLGIRTEAAILNEKGVDPQLMLPTLFRGIELLKENAKGKVISEIIDIYPNITQKSVVKVKIENINSIIGVELSNETIVTILRNLGFGIYEKNGELSVEVPSFRQNDIQIAEDIIEEIARVYGYHKIPNVLPELSRQSNYHYDQNEFYWIKKLKDAFLFWGFNEVYTYSMVDEELFEGPIENAIMLKNPLTQDRAYLRNSLIPSILEVVKSNKNRENLNLFEIANVYIKNHDDLFEESLYLSGVLKRENASFYDAKGVIEQLFKILGIKKYAFHKRNDGIKGAKIQLNEELVGQIESEEDIVFELNLTKILKSATSKKTYIEPSKFPYAIEDVRVELSPKYTYEEIISAIGQATSLVHNVSLLDVYENKKTFRITFLNRNKNLTADDITPAREMIYKVLKEKFKAKIG